MNSKVAFRVAIALGVLYFAVNYLTGLGVPEVISGEPALRAHTIVHTTTWPIFWINSLLLSGAFGATAFAIIVRVRDGQASPARNRREVMIRERFVSAWFNGKSFDRSAHVQIADGYLDLWTFTPVTLSNDWLSQPLDRIAVFWLVREWGRWGSWVFRGNGTDRRTCDFEFRPRHPRRWLTAFQSTNTPIRRVSVRVDRVPQTQAFLAFWTVVGFVPFLFAGGIILGLVIWAFVAVLR